MVKYEIYRVFGLAGTYCVFGRKVRGVAKSTVYGDGAI
jgi:hypothetical protein